jgi:hypothetical protein
MSGGRPYKLNAEMRQRLISYLSRGHFRSSAAEACGIHPETLGKWMEKGKRSNDPASEYRQLYLAVATAEGEAQDLLLRRVQEASEEDARHAEWILARRWPENWARKDEIKVGGTGQGGAIEISVARDLLEKKLAQLGGETDKEGGAGPEGA